MRIRPVVAVAAAAGALFATAANAAESITVSGMSDIFAAGQSSSAGDPEPGTMGGGFSPAFIYVSPGQHLTITATGVVSCCVGSSTPSTGPDGFASNPFGGGGTAITSSFGNGLSFTSGTNVFSLVGVWGNGVSSAPNGGVDTAKNVFEVGSSASLVVPDGDYRLYFGLPDAAGFNGASGYYGDNDGSFDVTVSGAPEPASWALMMGGVGFLGLAIRSRRRRLDNPSAAAV